MSNLEEKRRQKTPLFVFVLPADDPASKGGTIPLAWFELACGERGTAAIAGLRREWPELLGVRTERTALKILQHCVNGGWLYEEPEKRSKEGAYSFYTCIVFITAIPNDLMAQPRRQRRTPVLRWSATARYRRDITGSDGAISP